MIDLESIESSVRLVSDRLRVLLLDQSPLVAASTLDAAVDAVVRTRRYLLHGAIPSAELSAVIEFMEELMSMLTSLLARDAVAR
ncbi:MAG: hypothetical protein JWN44_5370 [Myxococcales bacterium]|nr:hypothetical protein [Myxococcales bacterium]